MATAQGRPPPEDIHMADLGRLRRAVPDARMGHLDSRWLASIAKRSFTDRSGSLGTGDTVHCPSLRRRSIHRRKEVMVVVREKTTVTQRIHGNCPIRSRTEIAVRDVGTVLDEPKDLLIESLQKFHYYYGDDFKVECPSGSGNFVTIEEVAEELTRRVGRLFLRDEQGRRAVFGDNAKLQSDPHFRNHLLFYEYFHGDNGRGVGASHQSGWTRAVCKLLQPH